MVVSEGSQTVLQGLEGDSIVPPQQQFLSHSLEKHVGHCGACSQVQQSVAVTLRKEILVCKPLKKKFAVPESLSIVIPDRLCRAFDP